MQLKNVDQLWLDTPQEGVSRWKDGLSM